MGIFRKRKYEDENAKDVKGKKDLKKNLRRRRKKKDYLPRPWEKKDRLLVLFFLLGSIVISSLLALSARGWKLPGLPRLDKINLSFLEGGVIELGGRAAETSPEAKVIINSFKAETRKLSGIYGLYVVDLKNKESFGASESEVFQAASLIKLPVMVGLYQEVEEDNLSLDDTYTLEESDRVGGAGSLQLREAGYEISYRKLLEKMGKESDNTAFGIVRRHLGEAKIKKVIDDIGMIKTNLEENETSPRDVGVFFQKLWEGDLIAEAHKEELLSFLVDTDFEEHLVKGVPGDIDVSHKYGREVHVVNDAGIVFTDNPYAVVIMSKDVVESEADEIFSTLSEVVYQGMK